MGPAKGQLWNQFPQRPESQNCGPLPLDAMAKRLLTKSEIKMQPSPPVVEVRRAREVDLVESNEHSQKKPPW